MILLGAALLALVGAGVLLAAPGSSRYLGALLLVGSIVGGVLLDARERGTGRSSRPESKGPDAVVKDGPIGGHGLPVEAEELWDRIVAGKLRFADPELEAWTDSHPGAVADLLRAFAALRGGDYERSADLAGRVLSAGDASLVPEAARIAGEAAWALARYDDAIAAFQKAKTGEQAPAIERRIEAVRREKEIERSYVTLSSEHFQMKVPGGDEELAREIGGKLDAAWVALEPLLGAGPPSRPVAHLYRTGDFSAATSMPPWVTGLYDGRVRLPIGELKSDPVRLDGTIRHEVAHVFVTHRSGNQAPAWLQEGIAELAERGLPADAGNRPAGPPAAPPSPPFPGWLTARAFDLGDPRSSEAAYQASTRFVEALEAEKGWVWFGTLLGRLADGEGISAAFLAVYGRELPTS
jgi:hypothetical protein